MRRIIMEVKSMARVKYSYNIDGISLSGLSSSNVVTTEVRKMNLLAKKLANTDYFKPQDIITYTIILSNNGNVPINNIILEDDITSQNFIFDSLQTSSLDNRETFISYDLTSDKINMHLDQLKEQEIIIITYKTIIGNNVSKIKTELRIECDELKNIKEQSVELNQGFASIDCVKKVSNEYTYLNTNLSYELSLINNGNVPAYNVEVFDDLPVTYELDEKNGVVINNIPISYLYANNVLSFVLPEIPALSEVCVQINGRIVK